MNGRGFGTERVLEGIDAAVRVGLGPVKINCVVERGVNEDSIVGLARAFKGTGHIVRFIEFMDVGTVNDWNLAKVVTAGEIVERIDAELPLEPADSNYHGEVAQRWVYKDGGGEIGVISSVSAPFCRDCTRARLTIEGRLMSCLFAESGTDLRGPMRGGASDDELRELIARVWRERERPLLRAALRPDRPLRPHPPTFPHGDVRDRGLKGRGYRGGGSDTAVCSSGEPTTSPAA